MNIYSRLSIIQIAQSRFQTNKKHIKLFCLQKQKKIIYEASSVERVRRLELKQAVNTNSNQLILYCECVTLILILVIFISCVCVRIQILLIVVQYFKDM